jgi:hypothetical protein
MSKRVIILLAVIALIIGVVAGSWSVAAIYNRRISRMVIDFNHHTTQLEIQWRTSDAETTVDRLRILRAGKTTNAIEWLEHDVEIDLISLEPFVTDPSDFRSYPSYIGALQEVRNYRNQFPYKTNPSVETNVAEVFSLLDVQTNR